MSRNIIDKVERRNDMKRVFADSSRYYLDDLIYSIQEKLQCIDPCSEEHRVLFEKLMILDERKSNYDSGVRKDQECKKVQESRARELDLKEKQIQSDYDLAKKKVEAYQEIEEARIYAEHERYQLEYQRTVSSKSNSSFGLLDVLTGVAIVVGVGLGAYNMMSSESGDYIEDCSYDYDECW